MFPHISRWKINLWVSGSGSFLNIIAMTIMLPFLPHYLETLGDYSARDTYLWSSLIYASTFLSAALCAPLWGRLSDARGCKINLVRASVGMLLCMTLMGFADTAWQMLVLRLLAGVAGGYTSGATILMAKEAPEERAGWAQGVLSACILSGSLAGPMLGGFLSAHVGMREAFLIAGTMIFFNVLATLLLVKERHVPRHRASSPRSARRPLGASVWVLLIATGGLLVASLSIEPIVYRVVEGIDHRPLATASAAGVVLSATALGSLLSSVFLGGLADRFGAMRVAMVGFAAGTLLIIPQAFVGDVYLLALLRFAMGLALGGVLPCLKAAIRHLHADAGSLGRIMGLSTSFQYIGQVAGPLMGGVIAAHWGMARVFHVTAAVALGCALMLAAANATAARRGSD